MKIDKGTAFEYFMALLPAGLIILLISMQGCLSYERLDTVERFKVPEWGKDSEEITEVTVGEMKTALLYAEQYDALLWHYTKLTMYANQLQREAENESLLKIGIGVIGFFIGGSVGVLLLLLQK